MTTALLLLKPFEDDEALAVSDGSFDESHQTIASALIVAPCQDQDVPLLEETNFVTELPEEILIIVVNSL